MLTFLANRTYAKPMVSLTEILKRYNNIEKDEENKTEAYDLRFILLCQSPL